MRKGLSHRAIQCADESNAGISPQVGKRLPRSLRHRTPRQRGDRRNVIAARSLVSALNDITIVGQAIPRAIGDARHGLRSRSCAAAAVEQYARRHLWQREEGEEVTREEPPRGGAGNCRRSGDITHTRADAGINEPALVEYATRTSKLSRAHFSSHQAKVGPSWPFLPLRRSRQSRLPSTNFDKAGYPRWRTNGISVVHTPVRAGSLLEKT